MASDIEKEAIVPLLRDQKDPITVVYAASLMGLTKGLWKVSGEGSGGVTRAFGEDLWHLVKTGSVMLGEERDMSSPESATEFYDRYLIKRFGVAESADFNITEGTVEMTVKTCNIHHYTDYLEQNDVPRSVGCPMALIYIAMMEEVIGEPLVVDKIEHSDSDCKIVLKKF